MNEIHLPAVDLNLLVVLDVLLRERSVTRAAERLHVTRSAVSHALKRLRELFGDELLVRDGRRMMPTVRAEGLAETLPRILQQLTRALADPEPFEPATSRRVFRLAAPDFIAPLIPKLLRDVGKRAPGVRVEFGSYASTVIRDLAEGRHDALIAPSGIEHEGVRGEPVGSWAWAVYGRKNHPAFADWSAETWAAYPHLQIRTSIRRGQGPIDRRAAELGLERVVGAVIPHFSMAAPILAETDLLLSVPSVVIGRNPRGLACSDMPFELPEKEIALYRSATGGDEPGVQWFLERVSSAYRRWTGSASRS